MSRIYPEDVDNINKATNIPEDSYYYYIGEPGYVEVTLDRGSQADVKRKECGNYYHTYSEALKFINLNF